MYRCSTSGYVTCHPSCGDPLQWRYNERDGVSNHQPHDCLLKRLLKAQIKWTPKLRVTGLCEGNSPVTGEFPSQRAGNAENVSIWWRHHAYINQHHFVVQVTKYFDIFRMCVSLRSVSSNTINPHTQHINVKQYLFLIYICYILLLLLIKLCVSWRNEADTAEFQWPNLTTQIDILCVSILFRYLLQWLHMWSVGILEADLLRHTKHKIAIV